MYWLKIPVLVATIIARVRFWLKTRMVRIRIMMLQGLVNNTWSCHLAVTPPLLRPPTL